jgi:hypothetical protein
MNTNRDLLKRLLHLYPIKIIKDHFQETGNANDVIEVVTGNKTGLAIKTFASNSYLYTRQNIYLYKLGRNFNSADIDEDFPFKIESSSQSTNEYSYFLLPKTTFTVYLSNPTDKEDLIFYQPVMIRFVNKVLAIHFTKLNKNEKYYYPENRSPKKSSSTQIEDDILGDIIKHFQTIYTITSLDINTGIKYIWDKDSIDCVKIQWRLPHSVNTATMDETLTFKEKYPDEYENITLRPLGKTNFIYLKDDESLCAGFTVDPSEGYISITSFPKHPNQVTNVISEILTNNQ